MEDFKRRVIIINNVAQKQYKIEDSKALNFGELKKEMDEHNIPYNDLEFFEGHLGATMEGDNTALPKEIPYKGEMKSDLVFWASVANKKFNLGGMTRKECYEYIKSNNLAENVKNTFGDNFTRISTQNLIGFVVSHPVKGISPADESEPAMDSSEVAGSKESEPSLDEIVSLRAENKALREKIRVLEDTKQVSGTFISEKEIQELFSGRVK